jgi:hypothetical protein
VKNCDVDGIFIAGLERSHGIAKLEYSSTGRDLKVVSSGWQRGFRWKSVNCKVPGISITFRVPRLSIGSLSKDADGDTRWVSPVTPRSSTSLHYNDRKD